MALGVPSASDLIYGTQKEDPEVCRPAWADCRLQSDSPARGKRRTADPARSAQRRSLAREADGKMAARERASLPRGRPWLMLRKL
jgi:hypothetical protein